MTVATEPLVAQLRERLGELIAERFGGPPVEREVHDQRMLDVTREVLAWLTPRLESTTMTNCAMLEPTTSVSLVGMVDLRGATIVEVRANSQENTLHVSVDGVCLLRAKRSGVLLVMSEFDRDDEEPEDPLDKLAEEQQHERDSY